MRKNILKIIAFFIFGMAGGIFAEEIFWPYFVERPLFYQYRLERGPVYVAEKKEIIIQENTALKNAIEKVEKIAVGVKTRTREGSGLIVSSDGLVVTLAELIPQGVKAELFWEGRSISFQILKRDLKENLVLIKLGESNLPTAKFADSDRIKLGERVFLIGVVFDKTGTSKMINEGIVRNLTPELIKTNISEKLILKGSPLFDIEGNVLGLNSIDAEGKIVAIPISKIKEFTGL